MRLDVRSLEDEVVGESLDAGTFADAEAAVLVLLVRLELPFLMTEAEHLGRGRMQRGIVGRGVDDERWLVPSSAAVATIIVGAET